MSVPPYAGSGDDVVSNPPMSPPGATPSPSPTTPPSVAYGAPYPGTPYGVMPTTTGPSDGYGVAYGASSGPRLPLTSGTVAVGAAARWAIAVSGVFALAHVGVAAYALNVVNGWIADPETASEAQGNSIDTLDAAFTGAQSLATLIGGILLITWLFKLSKSDRVDAGELKHSSGWVIGAWFVPFLNFVRPVQIVRDLWWGATPVDHRVTGLPKKRPIPGIIGLWWAAFLVTSLLGQVILRLPTDNLQQLATYYDVAVVDDIVSVVAAVLAFRVFSRLARLVGPAVR